MSSFDHTTFDQSSSVLSHPVGTIVTDGPSAHGPTTRHPHYILNTHTNYTTVDSQPFRSGFVSGHSPRGFGWLYTFLDAHIPAFVDRIFLATE